jgi:hypothetical protein
LETTVFGIVSKNPVGSFLTIPANYRNSYAQQFNFGVEHELKGQSIVLKMFYLGNLGRRLDNNYTYNQAKHLLRCTSYTFVSAAVGEFVRRHLCDMKIIASDKSSTDLVHE